MKINPITNPNILRSYQAVKPAAQKTSTASKQDEVSFSEEALSFSKTMAAAKETLETRSPEERARIAEIKNAVRNGTYKIDSDRVADRILESVAFG